MIMKRLTPEEVLRAFIEKREVYSVKLVDPATTFIDEIMDSHSLVTFTDTPQEPATTTQPAAETEGGETLAAETIARKETETGRHEATVKNTAVAKTAKKTKPSHEDIITAWKQGWTVKQISTTFGISGQTVRNHIAKETQG